MLVLTRKANEQILIGDDIKITLVRIRGNSVRVGIEAPRDVRVVRGELELRDDVEADSGLEVEIDQESVFAHPQQRIGRHHRNTKHTPVGSPELTVTSVETITDDKQVVVGRVLPATDESKRARAPLAGFVSAT